jgi:hypothetical protein
VLCSRYDLLRFRFGSGSSFGKVLIPFPAPAAVPVPVQIIFSGFRKTNKLHKLLPFECQKQLISQKVGFSFKIFYSFILFYVVSGSKSGTKTVMRSGSAFAKAKCYGSCCAGSTTLNLTIKLMMIFTQRRYGTDRYAFAFFQS